MEGASSLGELSLSRNQICGNLATV